MVKGWTRLTFLGFAAAVALPERVFPSLGMV